MPVLPRGALENAPSANRLCMWVLPPLICFALGDNDFYIIFDQPDRRQATAASLLVNAGGAGNAKLTVLITPEELDEAAQDASSLTYRPPGQ